MRIRSLFETVSAVAALALLAGCSGGPSSAIAPTNAWSQDVPHLAAARTSAVIGLFAIHPGAGGGHRLRSFNACPAKGPIKYVSDYNNNVVFIYSGKFAGQSPCGQLTSGLLAPWGIYVEPGTHDLYVANDQGHDILVFHRGQQRAFNAYTDPTSQDPVDVVVAKDGTVIATNLVQTGLNENGSVSTWIGGASGGTFVGNFPMPNGGYGLFVTVHRDGTVYYDKLINGTNIGALWTVSCPAGACGVQTQVAGVSFNIPGGLAMDDTGDVLANNGFGQAETFELPNPNPSTFPVVGIPAGMAINELDRHWFVADGADNIAEEYSYPSGVLIGTVSGTSGGAMIGIAVDPGHAR